MASKKLTITLGTRDYSVGISDDEFYEYLQRNLSFVQNEDAVIEIPAFINEYLKKAHLCYKLEQEIVKLKEENLSVTDRLQRQEESIRKILDKFNDK